MMSNTSWTIATILIVLFLVLTVAMITEHLVARHHIATIEQLRKDVTIPNRECASEVYGLVASWNGHIAGKQADNKTVLGGILTSDKWDDVKIIRIPRFHRKEPFGPTGGWKPPTNEDLQELGDFGKEVTKQKEILNNMGSEIQKQ